MDKRKQDEEYQRQVRGRPRQPQPGPQEQGQRAAASQPAGSHISEQQPREDSPPPGEFCWEERLGMEMMRLARLPEYRQAFPDLPDLDRLVREANTNEEELFRRAPWMDTCSCLPPLSAQEDRRAAWKRKGKGLGASGVACGEPTQPAEAAAGAGLQEKRQWAATEGGSSWQPPSGALEREHSPED